jgi:hypothetical protein
VPYKPLAKRGNDHPIAWTPVHALDLAFENLDLVAKCQYLGLKLGLVAVVGRHHVKQEAHERIDERTHHRSTKAYPARLIARSGAQYNAVRSRRDF